MSFFIKPGSATKRKPPLKRNFGSKTAKRVSGDRKSVKVHASNRHRSNMDDDDEIESSADEIENNEGAAADGHDNYDAVHARNFDLTENADETRLRLTKQYLNELRQSHTQKAAMRSMDDTEEITEENQAADGEIAIEGNISAYLERENLVQTAKLKTRIADTCALQPATSQYLLPHKRPVTCLASHNVTRVVSCDKSATLCLWDIESRKRIASLSFKKNDDNAANSSSRHQQQLKPGNFLPSHAVSVSISPDGSLAAVGCVDSTLRLYDMKSMTLVKTFLGHRKSVTGVAFHPNGQLLFSASSDRSLKVWSVPERAHMETLFGHTENVTDMDVFLNLADNKERCITAGGADKSIRVWKIAESTQLLYRAPATQSSVDCVRTLNDETFITGGDDASLCVYVLRKNRPLWQQRHAHTTRDNQHASGSSSTQWISALACVKNSDLIASGACDGYVRFWKFDGRKLTSLSEKSHELHYGAGFVNALAFAMPNPFEPHADRMLTLAGIGQEHKWGRWFERQNDCKDGVLVAPWRLQ